jgi:hypothetical protein
MKGHQETAEREVLTTACEDWSGLWEPLWSLKVVLPNVTPRERERLTADAIRRLRDLEYISFIRVPWPGPGPSDELPALSSEDVEVALESDGWRQVPPDCDVWFSSTPAGDQAWYQGWPGQTLASE